MVENENSKETGIKIQNVQQLTKIINYLNHKKKHDYTAVTLISSDLSVGGDDDDESISLCWEPVK